MIEVRQLKIQQRGFQLGPLCFSIPAASYCVLMGRSGAGKTTLLEGLCGLVSLTSGQILLGDRDVTHKRPEERGIGYVPQDRTLFPTMTVREQLGFALSVRRTPAGEIAARVAELSELVGVAHLLDRMPGGLSGGEAQRVAIGRALGAKPAVLCLDEPLASLDEESLDEMRTVLKQVHVTTGVTVLHVTHSAAEAALLADLKLTLTSGRIEATA